MRSASFQRVWGRPQGHLAVLLTYTSSMPKTPPDPLRVRLLELAQEIEEHVATLRDFAMIPGNAWLAKGELQTLSTLLSDMDTLLEDIKQADYEAGY